MGTDTWKTKFLPCFKPTQSGLTYCEAVPCFQAWREAFGGGLRETSLTAMLVYVIALAPDRFCEIFGFRGRPISVAIETRHAADRTDILIETTASCGVIEAKVSATDPFRQSLKYPAKWRVLLTEHATTGKQN